MEWPEKSSYRLTWSSNQRLFPHLLSLDHLHSDQILPDLEVSEGACLTWLSLALNFFTVLEIVSRDREFVAVHLHFRRAPTLGIAFP